MSGFAELLPGAHTQSKAPIDLGEPLIIEGRKVYPFGKDGRPVFALHELPGFTTQFIGFCKALAGKGFKVYALLDRDYMQAAVLSQPSMPFLGNAEMALDDRDVKSARQSCVKMIAFRFKTDNICRAARQVRFETTFDGQIDFEPLPAEERKHAVLTEELFEKDGTMKSSGPSLHAFQKTAETLERRLS